TESAHDLARRTVRPRSRRQSAPDHGPLTLVPRRAGVSPRGLFLIPLAGRPRPTRTTSARMRCACVRGGAAMRELRHLFNDLDRQLEDAARAKQPLDAERWRDELRPGAV